MNVKKFVVTVVIIILTLLICFIFFGDGLREDFTNQRAIKKINKAMEMSLNLESANLETNILEGSYYPTDAPQKIETSFNVDKPNKDKSTRNIAFDITFYYTDHQKEVSNVTNYEGIYLNMYYPYSRYNEIDKEKVESIKVNEVKAGTEYLVYYKGSHLSRRAEWEYCKVESDYEYFLVNEEGVITDYKSDTHYKQKDEKNSNWINGESYLQVQLKDYTLLQ